MILARAVKNELNTVSEPGLKALHAIGYNGKLLNALLQSVLRIKQGPEFYQFLCAYASTGSTVMFP